MSTVQDICVTEHREETLARGGSLREILLFLLIAAGVSACLFLLRSPTFFSAHELNVDESQMLSQGMKFLSDPVPWRSVDGTSSGPLNSYLVSLFLLLGVRASYAFAHLLATALVCLQILVVYRTLLRLGSRRTAFWGILLLVFCYGFNDNGDYLHYASELLPALFLALGFHAFVVWTGEAPKRPTTRHWQLFLAGFALGMAPWCKIQALPIAGALGLIMLLAIIKYNGGSTDSGLRSTQCTAFLAGAVLPGATILGVVARAGIFRDFWYSYILGNIEYAGKQNVWRALRHLGVAMVQPETLPLCVASVLAAVLFAYRSRAEKRIALSRRDVWIFATVLVWLAAAVAAICRPARFFTHYTILLLCPMTYLSAGLLSKELSRMGDRFLRRIHILSKVSVAFLAAVLSVSVVLQFMVIRGVPRLPDADERIAAVIQKMSSAQPVHSMSIWGWTPGVYVLTGIPPATRDAIGHFVITHGSLQGYFRRRFVGDLRRAMPDVFIDTVSRGTFLWSWSEADGYESDAELREFIQRNYVLTEELVLVPGTKPVRFFRRRDAMPAKTAPVASNQT